MHDSLATPLPTATLDAEAPLAARTPETFEGPWAEAYEEALRRQEPLFVPLSLHADDRGWSLMNLFTGVLSEEGQVNYSCQYPGVIKAWHCHRWQTDFWACVHGQLKAGVFRESDEMAWLAIMGEHRPGVLIVPPGLWHGAVALGTAPAGLLYYVTVAYNPYNPDELRRPWDSVPGFPWEPRHG